MALEDYPRVDLAHTPTPVERMERLEQALGSGKGHLYVKRDDCTGLAMGGNKARQLEFYLGEAVAQGADTIIITGAVQSNFVRTAAAAARKCGMEIEIQLEERVANVSDTYRNSGNVLLDRIYGATLHSFPVGEDESAADKNLYKIADDVRATGGKPYVVPLGADHAPLGALGYVRMCEELLKQFKDMGKTLDAVVVCSGSAITHAGTLVGLRHYGNTATVYGSCVRRTVDLQGPRVLQRSKETAEMIDCVHQITQEDVIVLDNYLHPGYGKVNDGTVEAMKLSARCEALITDPVYTGKGMAAMIDLYRKGQFASDQNIVFIHSGGGPAIFAYPEVFEDF